MSNKFLTDLDNCDNMGAAVQQIKINSSISAAPFLKK